MGAVEETKDSVGPVPSRSAQCERRAGVTARDPPLCFREPCRLRKHLL